MDLRDWLIIVGVVIILGILVDGYRRMRLARMDSLKMSRDMGGDFSSTPIDDDYNPELPGGGARIVSKGSESEEGVAGYTTDEFAHKEAPVAEADNGAREGLSAETDFQAADANDVFSPDAIVADRSERIEVGVDQPSVSHKNTADKEVPVAHAGSQKTRAQAARNEQAGRDDAVKSLPQEVLVINVHAKGEQWFAGQAIKQLLEACGMDHGDMSIFHRHEEDDLLSPVQFSVANAIEPGYFDPDKLDDLSTPGVSFFMSLPGPKDYMKAFDFMLETAQCFAKNLNGELKDENRSVMTSQTIEHCRQRIREFERKQLSKTRL